MKKRTLLLLVFGFFLQLIAFAQQPSGELSANSQLIVEPSLVQFTKAHPGETGVLSFVVQNTGTLDAEDVEVWIPDTAKFSIGDKLKIGTIPALSVRTIQTTVKVSNDANPGVYPVGIYVSYKKKKTSAYGIDSENVNENWVVKLNIYGKPNFQLTPENTLFYRDLIGDLVLSGYAENSAKYVSAEISSNCLNVIGSGSRYIGDIQKGDEFVLKYMIQAKTQPCTALISVRYSDYSGIENTEVVSIGLQVNDNDIDFKITNISYETLFPGQTTDLNITVKNTGSFGVEDAVFSIDFKDPFSQVKTSEKYIDFLGKDETQTISFKFSIKEDAETKGYTVPLNIKYKISGVAYSATKQIGLNVEGNVILIITNIETKADKLQITIANIGTRSAKSINFILKDNSTEQRNYVDKLAPTKSRTQTFTLPKDKDLKLVLEYADLNNERKTIQEEIKLPGVVKNEDFPAGLVVVLVAGILIVIAFLFRKRF